MAAVAPRLALVQALLLTLRDGEIARLESVLSPDCKDHDAAAGQLPGRTGYAQKVLWFRAMVPDAHIVLERLDETPEGASAAWTTHAAQFGGALRFEGAFTIEGGLITSTRITSRGPA